MCVEKLNTSQQFETYSVDVAQLKRETASETGGAVK
jgi:hypothetical protein